MNPKFPRNFKIVTFFALFLFCQITKGQSTYQPNVNTPSPNASSLGQYGEVPVSLFTGVPNISVPIYTVQEGTYKLPISLSYHYSGVRPNVCPGPTGANWTLMAGGAITRVVKNWADEGNLPNANIVVKNFGFLFNSQLPNSDWLSTVLSTPSNFGNYLGTNAVPINNAAGSLLWDLNPDEFDFNVCGISGSFYLDQTGVMRVKCDRDVKVTYGPVTCTPFIVTYLNAANLLGEPGLNINKTFTTFTITDEDGTQYVFGEKTLGSNGVSSEAIEYSTGWMDDSFHATSWYLTSILLPNRKKISFTYDRGPFTTQMDKTYTYLESSASTGKCDPITTNPGSSLWPNTSINTGLTYSTPISSPIYLRNITTSSGTTVNLNYALSNAVYYNAYQYYSVLQQIETASSLGTGTTPYPLSGENPPEKASYVFWCASYPFIMHPNTGQYCDFGIPYYTANPSIFGTMPGSLYGSSAATNYFTRLFNWLKLTGISVVDNFNNVGIKNFGLVYDETGMLKLTQLQNLDSQNNLINSYQFAYNTSEMTLPGLLTDQTDHWGYYNYNGQNYSSNNFSIGTYITNKATFITDQSLIAEKAEVLKTITYPTGGTTSFVPDNNYFGKVIDKNNPNLQYDSLGYTGGVRIKRIINKDVNGNILNQKTYYYLHAYQNGVDTGTLIPSGELAPLPQYTYTCSAMPTTISGATVQFSQFSTQPIIPASQNNMGSYIGYSEVSEVNADGSYTTYFYTNYSLGGSYQDAPPDLAVNRANNPNELYPLPNNDNSEMRGHLLAVYKYNANNQPAEMKNYDQFQPLYTYPNSTIRSITGGELFQACGYIVVIGGTNTTNLYSLFPARETDLLFNPDGSNVQTVTTSTFSSSYKKLLSEASTASDGTAVQTTYSYPFNLYDPVSQAMTNDNIVNPVISKNVQKNGATVNVTTDTYQQPLMPNSPTKQIFVPLSTQIQIGANPAETRQNYLAYDGDGNLLCKAKPNGPNTSYQWGYNNQYPTVAIENAANSVDTVVQALGNQNAYLTLPPGSTQTYQQVVNIASGGSTSVTLSFTGIPNNNQVASINISITGPNGYSNNFILCNSYPSGNCSYPLSQNITGLAQGTYTISASFNYSQNLNASVQISVNYPAFTYATTGAKEFYFQGFEEGTITGVVPGNAHTGNKYYSGTSYTVNWTVPNSRSYVISYWYLNAAGVWKYMPEAAYTGPSKVLSITGATAYDDIRIYPVDALMTTYTYNPLIGMTSMTDTKGLTMYYEYDTYQRLMNIKDKDGNIIKHIDYHYEGH